MTPKTDSVAVLREMLANPEYHHIGSVKAEALEAAIAALSAQGECQHAWARGYGEPPYCINCGAKENTAPGGVGDAVTEADIDIMRDVYMTRAQYEAYQRILLAARTGKGEANGR